MKGFYCNGKEDFCDRDSAHDCGSCEHFDGSGGEEREVEGVEEDEEVCSDTVKVVRCKDCKHRHSSEFCECRPEDAFCSDGEKR